VVRPKITEKENLILSVPAAPLRAVIYSSPIERGGEIRRIQITPTLLASLRFDSTLLFSPRRKTNKI
jgi:hypothetical protein